ncbi:GNAT family N-acetyltransferase [Streptomyces sp. NPDC091383]|uniref:GNAT family N-acetyltransferase n=1 Tax=Streptomyces sp. NPDC091383 TaxID=3365996 RepID=UPI0038163F8A
MGPAPAHRRPGKRVTARRTGRVGSRHARAATAAPRPRPSPARGGAGLGYRIAERATGRGLATWAVRELCARAAEVYGLTFLTAASRVENLASRAVPARTGFTVVGETRLSGLPGLSFRRALTDAR